MMLDRSDKNFVSGQCTGVASAKCGRRTESLVDGVRGARRTEKERRKHIRELISEGGHGVADVQSTSILAGSVR
jgi:hypothetical protein